MEEKVSDIIHQYNGHVGNKQTSRYHLYNTQFDYLPSESCRKAELCVDSTCHWCGCMEGDTECKAVIIQITPTVM